MKIHCEIGTEDVTILQIEGIGWAAKGSGATAHLVTPGNTPQRAIQRFHQCAIEHGIQIKHVHVTYPNGTTETIRLV